MVNGANSILGLVPTMQSLALVSENVRYLKKKKKKNGLLKLGMTNIVGVNLIKATAQSI